ncbi:guanine nucleotide-binding protein-like 3 homolog [Lineus longissimus]|uniref:guanine nucleotide-binding protein-like 3 homolog n=1 Tax=Lineus longissimus TaxID=88925 RepID=UPI002B4EFF89
MPKGFGKKTSKRQTCRNKYKIQKKVREHNRKLRRDAKKNPHPKKKKDPGIPNSYPFKDQILKEAEERKNRIEAERERMREKRKKDRVRLLEKKRSLSSLVTDAQKRSAAFEKKQAVTQGATAMEFGASDDIETSRKAYFKEFKKVVDAADVIVEVLDARDPIGSRCLEVEEAVVNSGAAKKLVLLLNKIDLVPREIVEKWLKYLKNEFPTVLFKASTQTQRQNLSQSKMPIKLSSDELMKTSRCLGASTLMKLLNNYCRNKDLKTTIMVGVVGFPNTGKSSVINSLKRSKACNVGNTPGVTKVMQEVLLDKHIKLLDSPGIVMAKGDSDAAVILRNCVKIETIDDPIPPVEAILRRCNKEKLMLHYRIGNFTSANEFLSLLAQRHGKLKKGGIPDIQVAARSVLQDWSSGRITYYTHPPEEASKLTHVSATLVQTMAKEFDIDSLIQQEEEALSECKPLNANHMAITSEGPMAGVMEEEDDEIVDEEIECLDDGDSEEEMVEDEENELKDVTIAMDSKKPSGRETRASTRAKKEAPALAPVNAGNLQRGKAKKEAAKKVKKQRKRADKIAGKLSDALEGAMASLGGKKDEDYDFGVDFK